MNPKVLSSLRCPRSHTPLHLEYATYREGQIWNGCLRSAAGDAWPIHEGILELLPRSAAYTGAQLVNRLAAAAWGYERLWRPHALSLLSGHDFPLQEECALMIEQLAPRRGGVFLDLACSNALYGRALFQAVPSDQGCILALDHSLPMLREAQRRAFEQGASITFIRGLAEALPLADHALAGIACGGSFNEFTAADRVLSEARRTLEPDGRSWWMLTRQARSAWGRLLQRSLQTGGINFPQSLRTALTSAGLRVTWEQHTGVVEMIATRGRVIAS